VSLRESTVIPHFFTSQTRVITSVYERIMDNSTISPWNENTLDQPNRMTYKK